MRRARNFFLVFALLPLGLWAQDTRTYRGDYYQLDLPRSLSKPPSGFELSLVATQNTPDLLLSTSDGRSVLSVSKRKVMWGDHELELMAAFYKSSLYALFDQVEMLDERIEEENGQTYAYLSFKGTLLPEENSLDPKSVSYMNYLKTTLKEGEQVLFYFYCPAHQKELWDESIAASLSSARAK